MPASWKERVRGELWRGLLAKECEAVAKTVSGGDLRASSALPPLGPRPNREAFCFRPVAHGHSPWEESFLVFQAGRYFLIGPTGEAVRNLSPRFDVANGFSLAKSYLHIVLLSFEPKHIEGLADLLDRRKPADFRVTIWTSEWIWNETRLHLARLHPASEQRVCEHLKRLDYFNKEEARLHFEGPEDSKVRNAVIMFEEQMELQLTSGVFLQMEYVLAEQPSLRVRFRCNQLELSIDPLNRIQDLSSLDKIERELVDFYRHSHLFDPGMRQCFDRRYGRLRRHWEQRADSIQYWPPHALHSSAAHRGLSDGWQAPRPEHQWQFDQPVDCRMLDQPLTEIEFIVTKPAAPLESSREPESANPVPPRVAVAILCGGLVERKQRELLDPARVNQVVNGRRVSILAWRLWQIEQWAQGAQVPSPVQVLLMTSPDTLDIVERERAWFLRKLSANPDGMQIITLPQQLVPKVCLSETSPIKPDSLPDEGWRLDARGHADFFELLERWVRFGPVEKPQVCVAFAYNNLGRLFLDSPKDRDIARENIQQFWNAAQQEKNVIFGVEVFQLAKKPEDSNPRWNQMSFTRQMKLDGALPHVHLRKSFYNPSEGMPQSSDVWYSSHTWYVHCGHLGTFSPPERYVARLGWLRQDMEQVCYDSKHPVVGLVDKGEKSDRDGLHRWSRFVVVRTEDESYSDATPPGPVLSQDSEPPPLAESAPSKHVAVWGGPELARRKGWRPEQIAETWEVSTHPAGPSQIVEKGVLQSFLAADHKGHLPYMVKYLDCHRPLSLQVHPNKPAIDLLWNLKNAHGVFDLKDEWHKEESFYVIRPSSGPGPEWFHLFLGFDVGKLTPLADLLRPVIVEYHHAFAGADGQEAMAKLNECYEKLAKTLWSALNEDKEKTGTAQVIARHLFPKAEKSRKHLLKRLESAFTKETSGAWKCESLRSVFCYHVEGLDGLSRRGLLPRQEGDGATTPAPALLGKEYLFAGLGVLRFIAALKGCLEKMTPDEALKQLREVYGNPGGDEVIAAKASPLLQYFHPASVKAGQWCRIPPGTIHSWQGGGNLLVEIAHRSDNTFRVLDYAREWSPTPRPMHYWEAMYALTPESLLGEGLKERLVFDAVDVSEKSAVRRCHAILNYQLHRSEHPTTTTPTKPEPLASSATKTPESEHRTTGTLAKQWPKFPAPKDLELKESGPFSVILNPNHPLFLRTEDDRDEIKVGQCRAVMVHHGTQGRGVKFLPNPSDECVLHVYPSKPRPSLLCLSLGDTKLEAALWQSGQSPATDWEACQGIPRIPSENPGKISNRLAGALRGLLAGALRLLKRRGESCDRLEVALTWPGHIGPELLVSTTFRSVKKAALAGELQHLVPDTSSVDGEFRAKLTKRLGELADASDQLHCLSDAQLAALGEHRHSLGHISGSGGMALNIGSGVCAGFFEVNDKTGRFNGKLDSDLLAAASAIGRWLVVNPLTGKIDWFLPSLRQHLEGVEATKLGKAIISRVFDSGSESPSTDSLRLSPYLSSRGLALRFLSRIRKSNDAEFNRLLKLSGLDKVPIAWADRGKKRKPGENETGLDRFKEACQQVLDIPTEPTNGRAPFKPHTLFQEMGRIAAPNSRADDVAQRLQQTTRSFIREVAADIAEVIRRSLLLLRQLNKKEKAQEGASSDDSALPNFARCGQRIVLTGSVGQGFGWVGREDLLCTTIKQCLWSRGDAGQEVEVLRSRIAVASIREAEGFQYYLTSR